MQPCRSDLISAGHELVAVEQPRGDGEEGLVGTVVAHEHGQEPRVGVRGLVGGEVLHQALHQRDAQAVLGREVGLDHGLQLSGRNRVAFNRTSQACDFSIA